MILTLDISVEIGGGCYSDVTSGFSVLITFRRDPLVYGKYEYSDLFIDEEGDV